MFKKISAVLMVCLTLCCLQTPVHAAAASEAPKLNAKGVVLMEQASKRILYSQNAHEKMPMASTTKVMTALIAIEHGNLDTVITVPQEAYGVEGSSMYLSAGEHISVRNLLYGLMLNSGNDAAVAIAVHIAGSVEDFARLMNKRAQELGAFNTNFVNPHGLPADNHYTTAYDYALICATAMENQLFREIVSTQRITVPWEGRSYDRVLKSHNKILTLMEDGNGIKTGYTKAAGRCLCGAAQRDGMQLISVVLNDPNYFEETIELLNWGFSEFGRYTLLKKGDMIGTVEIQEGFVDSMELRSSGDITVTLSKEEAGQVEKKISYPDSVLAPVKAGDKAGTIRFFLNGEVIAEQPLLYPQSTERDTYGLHLRRAIRDYLGGSVLGDVLEDALP